MSKITNVETPNKNEDKLVNAKTPIKSKTKLVIVESPNKIKSIQKYLGSDYVVMASVGHIFKLPTTGELRLGIDLATWEPKYKLDPGKKDVVDKLKTEAKVSSVIYIATDPDREGEAIGDNLVTALKAEETYKRIRFNEITKNAIETSIKNATVLDEALVNAQKTRRMLDRIIGFRLSTLMSRKMTNWPQRPTAGRVQSIALKLIVEKEREIEAFVPVLYSKIDAEINPDVIANYYNSDLVKNKDWIPRDKVDAIHNSLKGDLVVTEVKHGEKNDATVTPFKQAVLYKQADSRLGMSSIAVQSAAQKLYEGFGDGGLISYPRTDSTRLSDNFVKQAQEYILNQFGPKYVSKSIKGSAGAQDAHEAIRPTDVALTPEMAKAKFSLGTNEAKLYKLIYNKTLQAIMTVPRRKTLRYELENNGHKFKMSSSKIIFEGYYKVTGYDKNNELPIYEKNQKIPVSKYIKDDYETKPPARYNEGSLIEKLDNIGVGRPSTFATTVKKIKDREYVEKEGKALKPTEFGKIILDKLVTHFPDIINETYTAGVEKELDDIAESKRDFKKTMSDFYTKFDSTIEVAFETMEITRLMPVPVGEQCPDDQGELIYKRSRKGDKFIACNNWPNCTYTRSVPKKFGFWKKKKY